MLWKKVWQFRKNLNSTPPGENGESMSIQILVHKCSQDPGLPCREAETAPSADRQLWRISTCTRYPRRNEALIHVMAYVNPNRTQIKGSHKRPKIPKSQRSH